MNTHAHSSELAHSEYRNVLDTVKEALRSVVPNATFAERERVVLELSNTALRELLEEALQAHSDDVCERVRINGIEYAEHSSGTVCYHSLVGPLSVSRKTYREIGVRNGPTVVPLDLIAGIVERATPALAYGIALGYSRTDMRDYLENLQAAHREPLTRATLERIAKSIAAINWKMGRVPS